MLAGALRAHPSFAFQLGNTAVEINQLAFHAVPVAAPDVMDGPTVSLLTSQPEAPASLT